MEQRTERRPASSASGARSVRVGGTLTLFAAGLVVVGACSSGDSGAPGTTSGNAGSSGTSSSQGGKGGFGGAQAGGSGTGGASAGKSGGSGSSAGTAGMSGGSNAGAAGTGGISGTGGTAGSAGSTQACSGSCDDGFNCTVDSCVSGKCAQTIGPATGTTACPLGQYCTVEKGCTTSLACANDAQCIEVFKGDACKAKPRCDAASSVCVFELLDKDGDGHAPQICGGDDCDDGDSKRYPGNKETCDGTDNDCDGKVDVGAPCSDPLYSCQAGECRCKPENYCQGKSGSSYICVDTQTNPNYCGTCANAQYPKECLPFPGWSCVGGECLCPDSEKCDGKCVNVFTDSENCGACGRTCPVALGGLCSAGTCYCGASNEPTKLVCAGACVDVASDVQHCGKCDNACTAAPGSTVSCKAGVCVQQLVCPPDVGDCDGDASNGCETNLKKDVGNCGACGANCGFSKGPWCNNGTCASCPTQPCGGVWVDQKTDPMNCGGCGVVCAGGQTCVAGGCL